MHQGGCRRKQELSEYDAALLRFLCVLSLHSMKEETVMQRLDTLLTLLIRTHAPCPGSLKVFNSFVGVKLPCQLWVAELGRPQTT